MYNAPEMLHPDVKASIYQLHKTGSDIPSLATKFKMKEAR
jgi:hypothetical protein